MLNYEKKPLSDVLLAPSSWVELMQVIQDQIVDPYLKDNISNLLML